MVTPNPSSDFIQTQPAGSTGPRVDPDWEQCYDAHYDDYPATRQRIHTSLTLPASTP